MGQVCIFLALLLSVSFAAGGSIALNKIDTPDEYLKLSIDVLSEGNNFSDNIDDDSFFLANLFQPPVTKLATSSKFSAILASDINVRLSFHYIRAPPFSV